MNQVVAIVGPTAAGKSEVAVRIAERVGGEVISVDSMQVYRGMDIGTAKPTVVERRGIRHHLIDVAEPEEVFTVAEFRRQGREVMDTSEAPLIIAGGSGLHFRALVDPMSFAPSDPTVRDELEEMGDESLVAELLQADPAAAEHVDLANRRRVIRAVEVLRLTGETPSGRAATAEAGKLRRYEAEIPFRAVGLDPGEDLEERVERRLAEMRSGGLVQEVRGLRDRMGPTARAAVGYREILSHLHGELDLDEAFELAGRNTMQLARRQRTWFHRDPRIRWIPWVSDPGELTERALEVLE
ncbi:MAG: tRNA (adenosine(37)-N6)-dimethylallyltransferase MiaA [Actinobacteria bacterium]|nr:tRNA (adenosine(37)-N6)-dimethylallyltransferase MiaA [Actinomycetota bacterium]